MWKSMQLSDPELRALVRDAIARHGQREAPEGRPASHASHAVLPLERGSDGDGACLIEPDVRCNHCGYCLSYGH
jgi:hypothetical protein